MKTRIVVVASWSLLAMSAHADWVLSDYATTAADSLSAADIYGLQVFKNPASTASVTAGTGSAVFKATYASDGTEGYTANVGLLHALTPDWAEHDLTGITGVTFEYKNSAKITDALAFSFGSAAYSDAIAKAGTVFENAITGTAALASGTTWKTASLGILDFAPPKWWTPSADFPEKADVLKAVKNVQFAPKTLYSGTGTQNGKTCEKCVGPDMTAITLEIRNVTLQGVNKINWPNPTNIGCEPTTEFTKVDDFADGNTNNLLGGYWYTFTDSGNPAVAADLADKSKGSSKAEMAVDASGSISMTASLNKTYGTWHDYAGWASLGMGFAGDGTLNAESAKLTAISFIIMGANIDKTVEAINFKATMSGVHDTALHQVALPVPDMSVEGGRMACIRPEDLKQASYTAAAHKVPFDATKMTKLAWEAKIADQKSKTINTAAASILISDVRLHGSALMLAGTRDRKAKVTGFSVRAGEGVLSLSGYQGIQGFDVVTLDGKKVTSFAPAATVALSLPRGSYFLVGKREGASLTKSFTIVR